jgi:NADH:ubiquinone oxidoreductase subunit F (NADH-binding)
VQAFRKTVTGPTLSVLDMPLDVALFRTLELSLGAGIVVYGARPGERPSMLEHARNCLEFFAKESCGKCVPCRLGCQQLVHFVDRLQQPGGTPSRQAAAQTVRELAQVMEITSICGLGRAASTPFLTWLEHFPNELTPPAAPDWEDPS